MNKFEIALTLMNSDKLNKFELRGVMDRIGEIKEILDYDNLDEDIENNLLGELSNIRKKLKRSANKIRLNKFTLLE